MSSPIPPDAPVAAPRGLAARIRRALVGAPRDPRDARLAHSLSLGAIMAWIGLGADGLSSSAYGPEEAFKAIGTHVHLAIPLAMATAATVFLLARAYGRVVESFPTGGGYAVATRCLGARAGVVSGGALLVDYVLTIAISIAAAADAIFSLAPLSWQPAKLPAAAAATTGLLLLNLRGVRESIVILAPIFIVFVLTHAILLGGVVLLHLPDIGTLAERIHNGMSTDLAPGGVGLIALVALFLNAYAMGGGTYTGIEAVSNALPLMREPRIRTARRTMRLLAWSLALCAGGLVLAYLLWGIAPEPGRTMNAVLAAAVADHLPMGGLFTVLTLVSASALLVVAAQAGFIGGPRVMANLAGDGWLPRRFTRLSDRLVTEQGILVMGAAALGALLLTGGHVEILVVLYAINVFLTFTLTMLGMSVHWWRERGAGAWMRRRRLVLFGTATVLCAAILAVTIVIKFTAGGWMTVAVTGAVVALCIIIRIHYRRLALRLGEAFAVCDPPLPPADPLPAAAFVAGPDSPPTLVLLTDAPSGTGWHTLLGALRTFPGHFRQVVVAGVAVVDAMDAAGAVEAEERLRQRLTAWLPHIHALGLPCSIRTASGVDIDATAESLCRAIRDEHPRLLVAAGKVLTAHEGWWWRLLHNDTALAVQHRLQWAGIPVHLVAARLGR